MGFGPRQPSPRAWTYYPPAPPRRLQLLRAKRSTSVTLRSRAKLLDEMARLFPREPSPNPTDEVSVSRADAELVAAIERTRWGDINAYRIPSLQAV